MLHELQARMMGDPRASLLERLAKSEAPLPEALSQLAALHVGFSEEHLPLRSVNLSTETHHFPHASDVPPLLLFHSQQLASLWDECNTPEDDLFVAAFGAFGILSIHPFADGNGRTAVDYAQYLLMRRWNLTQRPLDLPSDAPRLLGSVLATMVPVCDGSSPESFYQARQALALVFEQVTVNSLKEERAFKIVVHWMKEGLHPEAMPTLVS